MSRQRATICRAFTSPSCSYSCVLPTTSANRIATSTSLPMASFENERPRAGPSITRLFLGHEVGDPCEIGLAGRALGELTVAAAIAIVAFPIHADLRVTGF